MVDHQSPRERPHWNVGPGPDPDQDARDALRRAADGLLRRARGAAASAELVIVELITPHDVEAHQQSAGEGDLGFGPAAAVQQREGQALEIGIGARGQRRGLAKDPAEQGAGLFADVAQATFIGRRTDRRGQADVADDVRAVGEAIRWPQDEDGGQGGQHPDARMGHEPPRLGVGLGRQRQVGIELLHPGIEPGQELEAIVSAPAGMRSLTSWSRTS